MYDIIILIKYGNFLLPRNESVVKPKEENK